MPEKDNGTEKLKELSIQRRVEAQNFSNFVSGSFFFGSTQEGEIPAWWSQARDIELRQFWKLPGNDILQGAIASMLMKFGAMNWVLTGRQSPNPANPIPGTVDFHQPILAEQAEFGKGWNVLLAKTLTDFFTVDKCAFWELLGEGEPDEPIQPPGVLGIAHLDSILCQLTGDPTFPVLFNNPKTNKAHKLHASRVVHMVDMPAPNEVMYETGFCAVSRVIASSQILLKLARYKNEKLSDLPEAGLLLLNNIMPPQWEDVKANHSRERRRLGEELWNSIMVLIGLDPAQPVSAEFISFADVPDAFDELQTTNIYANIVALAFGVDVREFWPLSAGPLGTAAETLIQHQKARGKGVGNVISMLERVINWHILPNSVDFFFDFANDEEDRLQSEIDKVRTETIMDMWKPPTRDQGELGFRAPVSPEEIRQMLADNVSYFKEDFLKVDTTEEVSVTDTDRLAEKAFGRFVYMDKYKKVRIPNQREKRGSNTTSILDTVEQNYREGLIDLDTVIDFKLGEELDRRIS